jgi:hypothetical protein
MTRLVCAAIAVWAVLAAEGRFDGSYRYVRTGEPTTVTG